MTITVGIVQGIEERSGGDLAVFAACEVSAVLARAEGDVLLVTDTSPNAIVQVLGECCGLAPWGYTRTVLQATVYCVCKFHNSIMIIIFACRHWYNM